MFATAILSIKQSIWICSMLNSNCLSPHWYLKNEKQNWETFRLRKSGWSWCMKNFLFLCLYQFFIKTLTKMLLELKNEWIPALKNFNWTFTRQFLFMLILCMPTFFFLFFQIKKIANIRNILIQIVLWCYYFRENITFLHIAANVDLLLHRSIYLRHLSTVLSILNFCYWSFIRQKWKKK